MGLKVYLDLISQPCRSIYIILKSGNVPFEFVNIEILNREHLTEKYLKVTKLHKLPAISENGLTLIESIAILRYLDATGRVLEKWYPKELTKRAKVDEYLEWQHINVRQPFVVLFQRKVVFPQFFGKVTKPEHLKMMENDVTKAIDNFVEIWLTNGNNFITGNEITAADLWASCEIDSLRMLLYEPTTNRPQLAEYLNRVRLAANPYYDEASEKMYKMVGYPKNQVSKI